MKIKKYLSFVLVFAIVLSSSIIAVGAKSIKLNKTKITINKGEKYQLKLNGATQKIKWKSSKKSVAKVTSKGKVTAKKKGTAKITATLGKKKYTCTVKVENPKLSKSKLTLDVGKTAVLKVSGTSQKIKWSSSNKSVVKVTSKGIISAVAIGSAKITAKVGKSSYNCIVSVVQKYGKVCGNVTYLYNNFVGNRGDTGAYVYLIPKDGSAKNGDFDSYIGWALTYELEEHNIYFAKVDGTGNYFFDHIPVGEYICFIKSRNTNTQTAFEDRESYKQRVASAISGYVSNINANYLGEYVGYSKYAFRSITVYENDTTNFSYDFGITYI